MKIRIDMFEYMSRSFYEKLERLLCEELSRVSEESGIDVDSLVNNVWDLPREVRCQVFEIISNMTIIAEHIESYDQFQSLVNDPITAKEAVSGRRLRIVK